ncbi:MAG TPA: bifunctional [glutamine synthetase] adenylyltransferase/[glutamine synthetase]-adenylyl-L-tyrosine phosphorylase, partial [Acidimicrobiia bacterium]|nr:bifunctional [glutamine synthetase] adenylyltransferase/[glutamine synthetase]-adenylyl-L-tyrosine phosphorylase [Acidimicrobiia bacterium]
YGVGPEGANGNAADAGDEPRTRLRRWKRRELFRITVRDLLGVADMPAIGREVAALAEGCLHGALRIVDPPFPLAVVGMGKLGGEELNYASDVDVLFVHADTTSSEAERAARALLAVMAEPGPDGIVFRTDADLRPEGRSGLLSREPGSYEAYYERWAEPWEFQALLKARPVAGDAALGARFAAIAEQYVWNGPLGEDAIRDIRALKARSEEQLRRQGLHDREIKRGRGGIRDVEFAVQLLQLVHGRHDADIRQRGTLPALAELARHGYVAERDATALDAAYRFLRTVEHRLQLVDEQQVYALPADETSRTHVARVLGYRDAGATSALERFEADLRSHQTVVRAIHERLYFRPLLEAFAGAGPLREEVAAERLAAFGFREARQTKAAVRELTEGFRRQSRLMEQLFPLILEWLSTSPDPDLGLLQLRTLAEGPARAATLATAFRESAGAAERVCRLLGSSRVLGQAMRRNPEFALTLADDDALATPRTAEQLAAQARQTLSWRGDREAHREGVRRFKRRELLRIAARDLLGFSDVETVGRELAALADATVDAALRSVQPRVPFAVVGMGRLGGQALSYASDVDVLFVYEGEGAADFEEAERAANALIREIGTTTAEGEAFEVDARLRPEGAHGALARSVEGYRQYYERWAQVWEFQALTKARFVAGDPVLGHRFLAMVDPFAYRDPLPPDWEREIRRMKARIESERIPPGEDPEFHLKLGRGSLSDVEFTVQLLQLRHGGSQTVVRDTSTVAALGKLHGIGAVDAEDAAALADAYRFCERARNYRFLQAGRTADSLPSDAADAVHLARMMGYATRPLTSLRDDYRRVTRRARRVVERLFYGKT